MTFDAGTFDGAFSYDANIVTIDQLKKRLGIDPSDTSNDDELTRLCAVATGILESLTGGPLFTTTITNERVRTDSDLALILKRRPVVDVISIAAVWSGIAISITDLDIDYDTGIIRRRSMWPFLGGTNAYLVTYQAGWGNPTDNPIPFAAFTEAALVIAGHQWEILQGPSPAVTGWAEGTVMPQARAPFIAGYAFAIPNRALEIMRPYTLEAWV